MHSSSRVSFREKNLRNGFDIISAAVIRPNHPTDEGDGKLFACSPLSLS